MGPLVVLERVMPITEPAMAAVAAALINSIPAAQTEIMENTAAADKLL